MPRERSWGWPDNRERPLTPAQREDLAAEQAAVRRATGKATVAAAEVPAIVAELRQIPLGDGAPSVDVDPQTRYTGFSDKHGENPDTSAVLTELVDTGELRNN